ncbi:MAG TPA: fatty acid desaturase [Pyrinomonadaceae bacterium]
MQNWLKTKLQSDINWNSAIFLFLFHVGALAAPFFFSWKALASAVFLTWVAGSLGIGIGYHRLLTHRGFKTPKWFEYFLTTCGTLAMQGGAINWVVTHRIHHAFTEQTGDPHSPRDGRWWAHIGWILRGTAQQHSDKVMRRYAPDLMNDRVHILLNRLYFVPLIICGVVLLAWGGWPALMWGVFFRVTFALHSTWLVNSATHLWGSRRFETSDDSTNNWWVALLTFGEGWHNNHHAFSRAARHGLAWYEIDLNWLAIRAFTWLNLANSVHVVSRDIQYGAERSRLREAA